MKKLVLWSAVILILAVISLFIGYSPVTIQKLLAFDHDSLFILWQTRIPRTAALILSGMALALSGVIMQLLTRNRFVEPSTVGTMESASLGLLFIMLFMPSLSILAKTAVASVFAMAGSCLFMFLVRRIPVKSVLMVPLTGIMLGYIIGAITYFIGDQTNMLPSLQNYLFSSFSMIIKGNYELLWLSIILIVIAYFVADRFTVAGLGEAFTQNLGLNYRAVMITGLLIISIITALIICTVGRIPFVGLVVPNIISIFMGDNIRKTGPYIALMGAGLVLLCDIVGRLINPASEIPVGTMMGVIGSIIFLIFLIKGRKRFG